MSELSLQKMTGSAGNTFTLLKDWDDLRSSQRSYKKDADSVIRQSEQEIRKLKQDRNAERGAAVADAGASGVSVSSFNDALFYNDLKTAQEVNEKKLNAYSTAADLKEKARQAKRSGRNKNFSYSLGMLNTLLG